MERGHRQSTWCASSELRMQQSAVAMGCNNDQGINVPGSPIIVSRPSLASCSAGRRLTVRTAKPISLPSGSRAASNALRGSRFLATGRQFVELRFVPM